MILITFCNMSILLNNVLDVHSLASIQTLLGDPSLFQDGRKTAGKTAAKIKHNLQAHPNSTAVKGAAKKIEQTLLKHSLIKQAVFPAQFAKIMFSRYENGMHYGAHIDEAYIANTRTDLAFTLFLSDPDSYQGGELVLEKSDGQDSIKLPSGGLYIYPSNTVHRVAPVTSGIRLAAVGWIQSQVRSAEKRSILFDLASSLTQLPDTPENAAIRLNLLKVKNNLLRLWGD